MQSKVRHKIALLSLDFGVHWSVHPMKPEGAHCLINNIRRSVRSAAQTEPDSIDVQISAIADMSTGALRKSWRARFGSDPQSIRSRTVLAHLFAWRIQIEAIGGLDNATARSLNKIADALARDGSFEPKIRKEFSSGVVLSREWKGVVHKVTVVEEGFQHLGKRYSSLSDIARTITGTRWSGPRFFGLEQKERASRAVAP